ncbi:hypothetical protein IP92_01804 [Pseudoduganella flava]|uniref:Tetratricopeptide repeat protein n=1 Tax=Pseudoduganella flava TaxID=871742 RepID=A0A562PVE6_9BURK|nr:tetratricopeptide repeat protein [Pseudoduganella flava]QGZ39523.1 tetratricopeptide repeat protein [Pseudoduganella flava]TWI48415.1 hypothetical protein IP92_01804 [Pseudoduganella flava]
MKSTFRALFPAVLAVLLALASPVHAQPDEKSEDLYLVAMQMINEGRYDDAGSTLARMILQGPRHAGEWFDIALLHCALGHAQEAEALFKDIEARFDPPPGVQQLIAQQRERGCAMPRQNRLWALELGRGHDTNVNQGASNPLFEGGNGVPLELLPEYLPRADGYTTLVGDYLGDLGRNGNLGFAQFYGRRYDHESRYDSFSVLGGVEHPWRRANWRFRSIAAGGLQMLGGRLYQEHLQVQLRAVPPWKLPERFDLTFVGAASYMHYKTLSNFDAATADLRAILGYGTGGTRLQAMLGYTFDEGNTSRPGGDRDGWSARLFGRTALGPKLSGEVDWARQQWRGDTAYSPGLIDILRRQATRSVRAALVYTVTPEHSVQLEWRQIHNRENISIFQYDSRQIQLSWRWYPR